MLLSTPVHCQLQGETSASHLKEGLSATHCTQPEIVVSSLLFWCTS